MKLIGGRYGLVLAAQSDRRPSEYRLRKLSSRFMGTVVTERPVVVGKLPGDRN